MLKQARRHESPLAIIMFDLDYFKQINDNHGHEAGDAVLRYIGETLGSKVRESDIAARIGGEEFAILLSETNTDEAQGMAERLRTLIRESAVCFRDVRLRPTASFGVSARRPGENNLDTMLARADEAMYESKALGRNRVRVKP